MQITIKTLDGDLIHEGEHEDLTAAVASCVAAKISLNDASLNGASLNDADLIDASLIDADLRGATFLKANLMGVDWGDEERENGPLSAIFCAPWVPAEAVRAKEAAMAKLTLARPQEVAFLRQRLVDGLVDGRTYETDETDCGCLVGTLEYAAEEAGASLELDRNSDSPDEQWFLHILPGHRPQWNARAAEAVKWCDDALALHAAPVEA